MTKNIFSQSGSPTLRSRRSFLKVSGLAAAASAVTPSSAEAVETGLGRAGAPPVETGAGPVAFVNLLQGTQSTPVFSHGNTLPIAATPFGMAHWTVQTNGGTPWFFQPWDRRTQGFRCTHQLSPWLYYYGFATFLPVSGKVHNPDANARASSYIPEQAKLTPYSLEMYLLRYRTRIELVPTERCCIIAAEYDALPPGDTLQTPGFIIEIPSVEGEVAQQQGKRGVQFACNQTSGGTPQNFATYYVVEFSEPWESCETEHRKERDGGEHQLLCAYFRPGRQLQARVGTSFISFEQASFNLQHEIGMDSLATVRQRTADQ